LSAPFSHNLGLALFHAARFDEAEAMCRKALELALQRPATHALLSSTLLALGRGEEALAEAMHEPDDAFRLWALAIVHHGLGHGAESEAALRELIDKNSYDGAYQIAEAHAVRGEVDAAFEWLERAYLQRDGGLAEMKVSTRLRSLHRDPRWRAFVKKMGLDD
jgi:tetratricopeptide (TPR) repeat protein